MPIRKRTLARRYRLIEEIGSGGMGTVYRARDSRTGNTVAVKILHPHLTRDPEYLERFRREIEITRSLASPNIIRVLDFGEDGSDRFFVMEYVAGVSLHRMLRQRGAPPLREALDVASQIATALEEAHAKGVVHRDIKPENIIITPDGRVKVGDFGIARAQDHTRLTLTGAVMGTVQYMAPELLTGGGDARADIYSLGVILYQMLVGVPPFEAPTPWEILRKHREEPVPTLEALNIPDAVVPILVACLAKDPEDRYQDAASVCAGLAAAVGQHAAADTGRGLPHQEIEGQAEQRPARVHRIRSVFDGPTSQVYAVLSVAFITLFILGSVIAAFVWFDARDSRLSSIAPSERFPSVTPSTTEPTAFSVTPTAPVEPFLITPLANAVTVGAADLADRYLLYATKSAKTVTVYRQDISLGEDPVRLFSYDEGIRAVHSGNDFEEAAPNIALSPDSTFLLFADGEGIERFDLATLSKSLVIRRSRVQQALTGTSIAQEAFALQAANGEEVCCAIEAGQPRVALSGWAAIQLVLNENAYVPTYAELAFKIDGSSMCELHRFDGDYHVFGEATWSPTGSRLAVVSDGLVLTQDDPCVTDTVRSFGGVYNESSTSGDAAWSPDSAKLATVFVGVGQEHGIVIRTLSNNGDDMIPGKQLGAPFFSSDGEFLYYFDASAEQSVLMAYDFGRGTTRAVANIPGYQDVRFLSWISADEVALVLTPSCPSDCVRLGRVVRVNLVSRALTYSGHPSDFTTFIGFVGS